MRHPNIRPPVNMLLRSELAMVAGYMRNITRGSTLRPCLGSRRSSRCSTSRRSLHRRRGSSAAAPTSRCRAAPFWRCTGVCSGSYKIGFTPSSHHSFIHLRCVADWACGGLHSDAAARQNGGVCIWMSPDLQTLASCCKCGMNIALFVALTPQPDMAGTILCTHQACRWLLGVHIEPASIILFPLLLQRARHGGVHAGGHHRRRQREGAPHALRLLRQRVGAEGVLLPPSLLLAL